MTRIGRAAKRYSLQSDGEAAVRPGSILVVIVVVVIVSLAFATIQSVRESASTANASQVAATVIEKETDEFEIVAWRAFATGKVFDAGALDEAEADISEQFEALGADRHASSGVLRLSRLLESHHDGLDHESGLIAAGRQDVARRHHIAVSLPRYEAIDAQVKVVQATERVHASETERTADLGIAGSLTVAAIALILLFLFLRLTRYRDSRGRERENELAEQALSDPLTGLGNRRALRQRLERTFARADPTALALIDLDGFKVYNDTFGHAAGDLLLRRLGGRLAGVAAPGGGAAFRLGGDEFCVLVPAGERERLRAEIEGFEDHGEGFTVRASGGIVMIPSEAQDEKSALALVDQRMYAQKSESRGWRGEDAFRLAMRFIAERLPDVARTSQAVATLSRSVGDRLGLRGSAVEDLCRAAALHDVGKVAVPDAILQKAEALDSVDIEFVRRNPVIGERLLSICPPLAPLAGVVRASHERWDGSGYPDGLAGERIPLASRIIFVCAAFDAMTSDSAYRPAMSVELAVAELRRGAGTQFDPQVVNAFERSLAEPAGAAGPVRLHAVA